MEEQTTGNMYWIVSFSIDDAHIVEAASEEDVLKNPIKTYRVRYGNLKFVYLDIDDEAKKELERIRNGQDLGILLDPTMSIDDIASLLRLKDRKKDLKKLKIDIKLLRENPEFVKSKIKKYKLAQSNPDKLYKEIRDEMGSKGKSVLEEISKLTAGEINFGLPQAGYITGKVGFPNLDSSLRKLYDMWTYIRNRPENIELMGYLELKANDVAQINMKAALKDLFL